MLILPFIPFSGRSWAFFLCFLAIGHHCSVFHNHVPLSPTPPHTTPCDCSRLQNTPFRVRKGSYAESRSTSSSFYRKLHQKKASIRRKIHEAGVYSPTLFWRQTPFPTAFWHCYCSQGAKQVWTGGTRAVILNRLLSLLPLLLPSPSPITFQLCSRYTLSLCSRGAKTLLPHLMYNFSIFDILDLNNPSFPIRQMAFYNRQIIYYFIVPLINQLGKKVVPSVYKSQGVRQLYWFQY
jgi:hypothetical protein